MKNLASERFDTSFKNSRAISERDIAVYTTSRRYAFRTHEMLIIHARANPLRKLFFFVFTKVLANDDGLYKAYGYLILADSALAPELVFARACDFLQVRDRVTIILRAYETDSD